MDPTSPLHNTGGYSVFKGDLDTNLFKSIVYELSNYFDVFSIRFDLSKDKPSIYLDNQVKKITLQEIDFSLQENPKKTAKSWIQKQFDTAFDLQQEELYKFALIKIAKNEYWWLHYFHHIIIDGFGFTIMINHVTEEYDKISKGGQQSNLIYPSYFKAIQKNIEYSESSQYTKDDTYWKEKYAIVPKSIVKNKKENSVEGGERFSLSVSPLDRALFDRLTEQTKASLSQFTIAALLLYLGKTTDQKTFSLGTPIHNRGSREDRKTLGMFAAVLAYKGEYNPDQVLSDCIAEIKRSQRMDFRHRQYPISHLNRSLKLLSENRQHIFDVIINYEPLAFSESMASGIDIEIKHMTSTSGLQNPLSIRWCDYGKEYPLELKVDYMTTHFNKEEIQLLINRLLFIIRQFEFDLEKPLKDISILPKEEEYQLLSFFNNTKTYYPSNQTVIDLFSKQVANTPDAIALVFNNKKLTYKELDERSNQLARYLIIIGVTKENLIPICIERSMEMVIGVLGILKAGGAYVPIDPAYPQQRIDFILEDIKAKIIITQTNLIHLFEEHKTIKNSICIDTLVIDKLSKAAIGISILPNQLIYIIYTSGTTGVPKGVLCEHKGILNLALTQIREFGLSPNDCTLQFASISFDAFGFELYASLLSGGRIVIVSEDMIHSKEEMEKILNKNQVTIATLPPSYQQIMSDSLIGLNTIVSAGEPLHVSTTKKLLSKGIKVINGYGPTENSVCSTLSLTPLHNDGLVTIGKPLSNTQAYILDADLQLVPISVIGELCVSGLQLARGYLNREALTLEKFVAHPFKEGEVLYKTGDLARWLPDGNIEFIGRKDNQVKIRGYRIELGEIEAALNQLEVVQQSVVLAQEDQKGSKQLVVYLTAKEQLDTNIIQNTLKEQLPEYMVPKLYMQLDELPLTTNGKIDKKALPTTDGNTPKTENYVAPSTPDEKLMTKIWQDLLGIEKVGVFDNFFELGGDSIKAIQLVSLSNANGIHFKVKDLFNYQNIFGIVSHLQKEKEVLRETGILEGEVTLHPIQQQFFEKQFQEYNHYNQSALLKVSKLVPKDSLEKVLSIFSNHHDALRFRYQYEENSQFPIQTYGTYNPILIEEQVSSVMEITAICSKHQASLNIIDGDLMRFVWIRTPDEEDTHRLLIVIHHLAIDGVSWRILLEDLTALLTAQTNGKTISLPKKGSSYRQWITKLSEYASSATLTVELDYWKKVLSHHITIPSDFTCNNEVTYKETKHHKVILKPSITRLLMQETHRSYGTEINDLLLSALSLALRDWVPKNKIVIALEGHGREELFTDVDLNRTIGWFTSLYPVCLHIADQEDELGDLIATTKDMLRGVPNKGIGYGVLRYLSPLEKNRSALSLPFEDIIFNYLGSFDKQIDSAQERLFDLANEKTGSNIGLSNKNPNKLAINSLVLKDSLEINWSYHEERYSEETIHKLADAYIDALHTIVTHCQSIEEPIKTISDYNLPASVSYKKLQQFQSLAIHPSTVSDIYPLSPLQEGLLFHSLYHEDPSAYVVQFQCDLVGYFSTSSFLKSWSHLMEQHTILRTAIFTDHLEIPVQCVYKKLEAPISVLDYRHFSKETLSSEITAFIEEDKQTFQLDKGPLFKISLLKLEDNRTRMVFTNHHILWDGWSFAKLMTNFMEYYQLLENKASLPSINMDNYGDHIRHLMQKNKTEGLSYWKAYTSSLVTPTYLPFLKDTSIRNKVLGNSEQLCALPLKISKEINSFAEAHRITVNTFVQGVWSYLLSKYTGQQDVAFGTAVSGRDSDISGIENKIGLYINTIPVCTRIDENQKVVNWLQELQEAHTIGREEYSYLSLSEIESQSTIDGSLFDSLVVFENYPVNQMSSAEEIGFSIENMTATEHTNYTLSLSIFNTSEGLSFKIMYNNEVITNDMVSMILEHIQEVMKNIVNGIENIGELTYLAQEEEHQLLNLFNDTKVDYPTNQTIIDMFNHQATKTPDAIAVVFNKTQFTYKELDERSNQLAKYLITKYKVEPNSIVGICMDRSVDMIISILAILKTRSAYVSLDPNYPKQRLQSIIKESQLNNILSTSKSNLETFINLDTISIIDINNVSTNKIDVAPLNLKYHSEDSVYVLFTSGSTGVPKGVTMGNKALVNLLQWQESQFIDHLERSVLQFASINFDVSFQEIFSTLCFGQKLVLVTEQERKDTIMLLEKISTNHITHVFVPFVVLESLALSAKVQSIYPSSLKEIITAGEQLQVSTEIRNFINNCGCQLINQYGPSETHVVSSYKISDIKTAPYLPPIGTPIHNSELYILNHKLSLVPIGVVGELCVAGDALAKGYLNQEALTKEKFIAHPLKNGERLYKTGDLAKWLPDGNIEFIGRKDDQVKIRGYRIELGEIESTLDQFDEIQQSVVLAREDQKENKQLVAYLVSKNKLNTKDIQNALQEQLPEYMIPKVYVILDKLPITSNGKIDKKALPVPDKDAYHTEDYVAPSTLTELELTKIWQEFLEIDKISVYDNFFELGGNSLSAIRLISIIKQKFQQEVKVQQLFQYPTIHVFSNLIDNKEAFRIPSGLVRISKEKEDKEKKIFCAPGAGGNIVSFYEFANLLQEEYTLYGFQAYGLDDITTAHNSIEEIATQNIIDMQQIDPSGPYRLAGYSMGANVAHEMVLQLQEKGYEVTEIMSFDGMPYASIINDNPQRQLSTSFSKNMIEILDIMANAFLHQTEVTFTITERELESKTYNEQLDCVYNELAQLGFEVMNKSDFKKFINIFLHQHKIWNSYTPILGEKYKVPVTLFKAKEEILTAGASYGWEQVTHGEITVYNTTGSHMTLLNLPHVKNISKVIKASNDKEMMMSY
ncbi:hypothetical protein A8C32_18400 [Flavivirga aquatica]|uniref:Carrier domain-containing protein n=2 Tax=Flavivirga aquatica TaxID=1849968 RepID=A0A1E5T7P4_9FLAO|nr:hypothetical protein A8C32_18400 [Flavivirga aquatica]